MLYGTAPGEDDWFLAPMLRPIRQHFCELLVAKVQDAHWKADARWYRENATDVDTRVLDVWFAFPPGMDGDALWDRLERDEPSSWWRGQSLTFGWDEGTRIFTITLFLDSCGAELRDGLLRWIRDVGGVPFEREAMI